MVRSAIKARLEPLGRHPEYFSGQSLGESAMNLTQFRLETDADGIALVTWDVAGKR